MTVQRISTFSCPRIRRLLHGSAQSASRWISSPTSVMRIPYSPQYSPTVDIQNHSQEVHKFSHGGRIPPELLDIILFHVIENSTSYNFPRGRTSKLLRLRPSRPSGWAEVDTTMTPLQVCSLVCQHWAIRCRRALFSGATLIIGSSEDMEVFKQYITKGCTSARLQPIHKLIGAIYVVQGYSSTQSFCHRLHSLIPVVDKSLLEDLFLVGSVPDHFPRSQLSTPHWSIPPSIVTPPSLLPFRCITILDVHLPSLRHVSRYIRHLSCAAYTRFEHLTWDLGTTIEHATPHPYGTRRHGPYHVSISARGCTDNIHLCLYTALIRPDCPLHALQDNEYYSRVVSLLSQLWQLRDNTDDSHYYMIHWGE